MSQKQNLDGNGIIEIITVDESDANLLLSVGWRLLAQTVVPEFEDKEGWFSCKTEQTGSELKFTMGRTENIPALAKEDRWRGISKYVERVLSLNQNRRKRKSEFSM